METVQAGYVLTESGEILVQLPADNRWGFELAADDQTWDGGVGLGEWEMLDTDDPRLTEEVRDRLGWLLEETNG